MKNELIKLLPKGSIAAMDNMSSHRNGRALKMLEEAGIKAVFLSPYSMDINSAENGMSKVKSHVRKPPRTFDEVRRAVYSASRRIDPEERANCIRAAGYRIPAMN